LAKAFVTGKTPSVQPHLYHDSHRPLCQVQPSPQYDRGYGKGFAVATFDNANLNDSPLNFFAHVSHQKKLENE